jgi:hypothetical protein
LAQHPLSLVSIRRPLQARKDEFGNWHPVSHGYMELTPDEAVRVAYIENTGVEPKNFPAGSLAEKQWMYKASRKREHQTMKLEDLL